MEDNNLAANHLEGTDDVLDPFPAGDRFTRCDLDLLEYKRISPWVFIELKNMYRDYSRSVAKLHEKRQDKKRARPFIPTSFPEPLPSDHFNPRFEKGKDRRITGRELSSGKRRSFKTSKM